MKNRYMIAVIAGLFAFAGVASAEMISGTITNIDMGANKITLLRDDTRDSITVRIKDQVDMSQLQAGSNVTLDADRKLFGGWEAQSVENGQAAPADAGLGQSQMNEGQNFVPRDQAVRSAAEQPRNEGASPVTSESAPGDVNAAGNVDASAGASV